MKLLWGSIGLWQFWKLLQAVCHLLSPTSFCFFFFTVKCITHYKPCWGKCKERLFLQQAKSSCLTPPWWQQFQPIITQYSNCHFCCRWSVLLLRSTKRLGHHYQKYDVHKCCIMSQKLLDRPSAPFSSGCVCVLIWGTTHRLHGWLPCVLSCPRVLCFCWSFFSHTSLRTVSCCCLCGEITLSHITGKWTKMAPPTPPFAFLHPHSIPSSPAW